MLRPALRIRWAGPAVVLALVAAALASRAAAPAMGDCSGAAAAFGSAAVAWYDRYRHYLDAIQNGPRDVVGDAARRLTRATDDVVRAGGGLLRCLAALR